MSEPWTIVAYDPETRCPKCDYRGDVNRFSMFPQYARGHDGALISTATPRSERIDHLVIRCIGCGWEWLMDTADGNIPQSAHIRR